MHLLEQLAFVFCREVVIESMEQQADLNCRQ